MNKERREALQAADAHLGQAYEIVAAVRKEELETRRAEEADLYYLDEACFDISTASRRIRRVIERGRKESAE